MFISLIVFSIFVISISILSVIEYRQRKKINKEIERYIRLLEEEDQYYQFDRQYIDQLFEDLSESIDEYFSKDKDEIHNWKKEGF